MIAIDGFRTVTSARSGAATAGDKGSRAISRTGLLAGVLAGLVWGLAFVIPELLPEVAATELTIGRYLVYGAVSGALLWRLAPAARRALDREARRVALQFAVAGNTGYFLLLVLAVQHAGAPLAALTIGTLPVVTAIAGARGGIATRLRALAPSLALIAAGIAMVNAVALSGGDVAAGRAAGEIALGLAAAVGGVALWTWYAVRNARFMAERPDVGATAWSSAVGVATLAIAAVAAPLVLVAQGQPTAMDHLLGFVAASLVLGVAVSWLATALWNRASAQLPLSVAGQLIVVETLSGSAYSYAARAELPDAVTIAGFGLLAGGVVTAVRRRTGPIAGPAA